MYNVQEVPAYAKSRQATILPLTDAILMAQEQESRCLDVKLSKKQVWLNPDFSISSLSGKASGKPGMLMMPLALRQVAQGVAGMPAKAMDWFIDNDLGKHCSWAFNEQASKLEKDQELKFQLYSPKIGEKHSCFAINGVNYQKFPKSQILEAMLRSITDISDNSDPYIGVKNLAAQGRFAETIITPWELRAVIVLDDFTGPRGDRYVSGIRVYEKGDGTGACTFVSFLMRVKCANGLVDDKSATTFSLTHKGRDAFPRLLNNIRNSVASVTKTTMDYKVKLGLLPEVVLENPFAALVALGEKDLGERRVQQAREILDVYVKEMGPNADAVLNTVTHIGAQDKIESARESAQSLGGRILKLSPQQWLNAHARGMDVIQQRVKV